MATTQIELEKAAECLPQLIEEVGKGNVVVITMSDRPVAELVAYAARSGRRAPGSAKGLITLADDWDAPLEDFEEYTR